VVYLVLAGPAEADRRDQVGGTGPFADRVREQAESAEPGPARSVRDLGSQRGHVDPLVRRRREVADATLVQPVQQLVADRLAGGHALCRYLRCGIASRHTRVAIPATVRRGRPAGLRMPDPHAQAARSHTRDGPRGPPRRAAATQGLAPALPEPASRRRREPRLADPHVQIQPDQLGHLRFRRFGIPHQAQHDAEVRVHQRLDAPGQRTGHRAAGAWPPGHQHVPRVPAARPHPASHLQPRAHQQPGRAQQLGQRRLRAADPVHPPVYVVFAVPGQLPRPGPVAAGHVTAGLIAVPPPRRQQHRRPAAGDGGQAQPGPIRAVQQPDHNRLPCHHHTSSPVTWDDPEYGHVPTFHADHPHRRASATQC